MTTTAPETGIMLIPVADILPSPENDLLYRPIDPSDPEITALAESIHYHGIREPLVVTLDDYILSGHRRHVAAKVAGLDEVPCRVEPIRRGDGIDAFTVLLREYNRQRVKSFDEQVREEAISVDPEESYRLLVEQRRQKSDLSEFAPDALCLRGEKRRAAITSAKQPMVDAINNIITARREYWPLSDRTLHYALLNTPPLKHASKTSSTYTNDRASYQMLTDLLTRGRLAGIFPWSAIGDETRPFTSWNVHRSSGAFIWQELDGFCKGYYRDLQQSQPNHIEIVAEKLTVKNIIEPVAMEFCIPTTIGRGFCSIDPRYQMFKRFAKSGREKLIVLLVSDHDPDGEEIAHSFARSMRDDFDINTIMPVKVALTAQQVHNHRLPPSMEAKRSSSNFARFERQHGTDAYELEALPPEKLASILRDAINLVMDLDAFHHEVEQEKKEAANLDAFRRTTAKVLAGVKP